MKDGYISNMEDQLINIGGITAIFALAIREFFAYIKTKKNGNGYTDIKVLEELKLMNSNHLHSIEEAINNGNERLVGVIHNDNMKMIELLGEIKGSLKK